MSYILYFSVFYSIVFYILLNFLYFKMYFITVMAKMNFQQQLLQSSVSHDLSEIILMF